MLSNTIRDKSTAMCDGFKLFIQMFSGVVGGSALLRLQYADKVPSAFVWLSDALAILVVVTATIFLLDHYRSWRGYRLALSEVAGKDHRGKRIIPPPSFVKSGWAFSTMILVMALALTGFIFFNPLQIPN
jgi:hypothetical protein